MAYIKGLVSLLTPAYNSGKFIHRLMDSVLIQTYPYIEMVIIDDGSTDNTKDIVLSYQDKFKERGYNLYYFYQPNQGLSYSINNGLKNIKGEFLAWPDSDDWYSEKESIAILVEALSKSDDNVGLVRCAYKRLSEKDLSIIRIDYPNQNPRVKNLFIDAIKRSKHFWTEPGGWVIKTECLDRFIPNREIFTSKRAGQNYQLLYPLLFYKQCVAVEQPLYSYLIRKNSKSRGMYKTVQEKILCIEEKLESYLKTLETIKDIPTDVKKLAVDFIYRRFYRRRCTICINGSEQRLFRKYYKNWEIEDKKSIPV